MTRKDREEMNALSEKVYGKKSHWQSVLRNGDMEVVHDVSANGNPMVYKKAVYTTEAALKQRMEDVLEQKRKEAVEAAEAALKQAQGDSNVEKTDSQETVAP